LPVPADDLPVAVIGPGGSGLLAAAALSRSGVAFEVLEARRGIGGTWRYDESAGCVSRSMPGHHISIIDISAPDPLTGHQIVGPPRPGE
jgi:cation diffusion facilitator CzcD-associated flavoprotein CzcO